MSYNISRSDQQPSIDIVCRPPEPYLSNLQDLVQFSVMDFAKVESPEEVLETCKTSAGEVVCICIHMDLSPEVYAEAVTLLDQLKRDLKPVPMRLLICRQAEGDIDIIEELQSHGGKVIVGSHYEMMKDVEEEVLRCCALQTTKRGSRPRKGR